MTETSRGADELRAEIETTRQDLGETLETLAAKTDVKARAKSAVDDKVAKTKSAVEDKVTQTKDAAGDMISTVKDKAGDALEAVPPKARKQLPVAALAALGAAIAGIVYRVWKHRR
jgi:hypothetical protein